ncbi:phosphotransferase family protein [Planomicrobium sp. YIM 101495]|uniref:phosphotransferase family protein n=1 Tax=Planomicrobium sp. YIM 101495 TaxID=2665160 RepID=UPI0018A9A953|nr:aminoglycoside phosphotransferase family protein [Planomicrobium sp. YIM 101495]
MAQVQDKETVERLAKRLGTFLAELHGSTEAEVKEALQLKVRNPYEDIRKLYEGVRTKHYPHTRTSAQQEISRSFENFLEGESASHTRAVLIHGDFGASNILWNPRVGEISGIIDFGGSEMGIRLMILQ